MPRDPKKDPDDMTTDEALDHLFPKPLSDGFTLPTPFTN